MMVTSLLLVIASRYIVGAAPFYKKATNKINDIQMSSHLYEKNDNGDPIIKCDFYTIESVEDCQTYNPVLDQSLKDFYSDELFFDQSDPESGMALYTKQRLDTGYFIYTDDSHSDVAPKEDVGAQALYKTYSSLMKNDAVSYMSKNRDYIDSVKTINLSFIFLILVLPIVFSVTVFEYIIPLFLKRGRKTIGKLLMKIGVVDMQGLSPSLGRFTCRFLLFLFFEVALSVAFFIPLIVSMTMFTVSKLGQSFHDYVSGTYVVDANMSRIHLTKEELLKARKEAENFELKSDMVNLD